MFDTVAAVMIIVNSILMGWETEALTTNVSMPESLEVMMILCNIYFCLEIMLRVGGLRAGFFTEESRNWNLFDLGLVLLPLDGRWSIPSYFINRLLLERLGIFCVPVVGIVDSMKSLLWALIMLAFRFNLFADLISDLTRELQGKRLIPEAYTLVQAMLGGISWGEVSDVLMDIDVCPGLSGSMDFAFAIQLRRQRISPALLLLYVAFTMLAAPGLPICHTLARTLASTAQAERLNTRKKYLKLEGAFVDNALNLASQQRDFQIEKEMESKEQYAHQIRALFQTIDDDGSGEVSRAEIREMLEDPTLSAYFRVLGFETTDADLFFKLLDVDDSNAVSMQEFLDGCARLKGPARNMDVHAILAECRRIRKAPLGLRDSMLSAWPSWHVTARAI
ncbi:Scn11a [Symbiodinium pilosum]|uniref:Scn11a protein n=1 Tax=Symbiodinium pilosum TaxID=2952 RepID=A0A812V893_SYMPI|nr:Scn11a [Symbiodinium pilosum]